MNDVWPVPAVLPPPDVALDAARWVMAGVRDRLAADSSWRAERHILFARRLRDYAVSGRELADGSTPPVPTLDSGRWARRKHISGRSARRRLKACYEAGCPAVTRDGPRWKVRKDHDRCCPLRRDAAP